MTPCICRPRGVPKRAVFDSQTKTATQVDVDLKRERPDFHNNRIQDWAENTPGTHASAADGRALHKDELNALRKYAVKRTKELRVY